MSRGHPDGGGWFGRERERTSSTSGDDQGRDLLAQTFPRRASPRKPLSFTKLVENRTFHKAVGALRRKHHLNMTVAGTRHVVKLARWRRQVKVKKSKIPPGVLFRRYIKLTVICIRLCKTSYESLEAARGEYLSVSQYSEEFQTAIDKDGLVFDASEFKAKRRGTVSTETKRILEMRCPERTEKDIDHLMVALKSIQSFKEYPRSIQQKLCQVGWYESFGPKRAIIRQGHPPRSFYFILSGTVVVSKFDKKTHEFQILVFLQQGMSFGELAVIKRATRQATVSSKTTVELLCISVHDYRNIFMSGSIKSEMDSELSTFVRNIGFMRKFPVHALMEDKNQSDFLFHYFHRGQILARDSNNSDWIFIVKSGSVSVLRKLREVKPDFDGEQDEEDTAIEQCKDANQPKPVPSYKGPHLRRFFKRKDRHIPMSEFGEALVEEKRTFENQSALERYLISNLPGYFSETERMGLLDYPTLIEECKSRISSNTPIQDSDNDKLPQLVIESAIEPDKENVSTEKMARLRKTSKGAYLTASSPVRKLSRQERTENDLEELRKKLDDEKQALQASLVNRKTMADELDNKPVKFQAQTAADLHPMFIEVQVLERGQYFGVSNLVYGEQPSLSLVSNGAECVMISKKFFLEHALAATMDQLRQSECPFPPQDEMQTNLQDFVNWQAHRERVYRRLVREKEAKFKLKKGHLRQYAGQYSFRTGPI